MKSSDDPAGLKTDDGWSEHHKTLIEAELDKAEKLLARIIDNVKALEEKLEEPAHTK